MKTLITGGAGFIGSHLADRLTADGHQVTVLDNLSHGRAHNLAAARATGRCRLIRHDIATPGLTDIIADIAPEVIFHLAAHISPRTSIINPIDDALTNIVGTIAVLEAARRARTRKIVFTSSVAIYGPTPRLPIRADTATNPISPYAVSKLAGEHYLRQYRQLHGLESTTLALSNVYGPRQDPRGEAGVVAIFAHAMLTARPTHIYGDGSHTRDYVYVTDVVDALVRAATTTTGEQRLNIGTGHQTSDLQLHRAIAAETGSTSQPHLTAPRPADPPAVSIDPYPAQRTLGWQPHTPLAIGITHTVAALRANQGLVRSRRPDRQLCPPSGVSLELPGSQPRE